MGGGGRGGGPSVGRRAVRGDGDGGGDCVTGGVPGCPVIRARSGLHLGTGTAGGLPSGSITAYVGSLPPACGGGGAARAGCLRMLILFRWMSLQASNSTQGTAELSESGGSAGASGVSATLWTCYPHALCAHPTCCVAPVVYSQASPSPELVFQLQKPPDMMGR